MTKEEAWFKTFIAVAALVNSDKKTASSWADYAVEQYEQRFELKKTKRL